MNRIDVVCRVKVYEKDGVTCDMEGVMLNVDSHWNDRTRVVLRFDDLSLTVVASDLMAAIQNATNTGAH